MGRSDLKAVLEGNNYHDLYLSFSFARCIVNKYLQLFPDMEKGADTWTLYTEIFEDSGNFWILQDYLLSSWNKTL